MRKFFGLTPPIWIFLFTLVLIILSTGFVGGSPNNVLAIPLSIIVLGFVLYRVWTRQGDKDGRVLPPAAENPSGPVPAPVRARTTPDDARSSAADAEARPQATAVSKAETPAPADALNPEQRTLCLTALGAGADTTKSELAAHIAELLGATDAGAWKPAPHDDLELLARGLALRTLAGAAPGANPGAPPAHLQEETKKGLLTFCVSTLRTEIAALAGADATIDGVSPSTLHATQVALAEKDALDGLTRCSKTSLATLARALGHA